MMLEAFGEFIGTFILVLLGNGVVANVSLNQSKGKDGGWLMISFGWGLAVAMAVYVSSYISPAHLNPAVTIAFAMAGGTPWSYVIPYIVGQMLGGFLGAVVVWLSYRDHYEATQDAATILGTFSTGPAIKNTASNLITEAVGTFMLVFGIMALSNYEIAGGLNPLIVGALIVSIGVSLGGPTGYAINPARDLGPRIAHAILPMTHKGSSDWSYAWVPVVGPLIGGAIAAIVAGLMP